jgi:NhaP-type Na+/H+ or K+/H+ antiporter
MYAELAVLAFFVWVFSLVAGRVEKMWLSAPIVYLLFGIIAGPMGFGWLSFDIDGEGFKNIAELTLALVLFHDAAGADLKTLRKSLDIPRRMLALGLPMTIFLGFALGILMFDGLTLIEVAILATMLAPTDAALGKSVILNPDVPAELRESLNAESGINDGICVPVLLLFLGLAAGEIDQSATIRGAMKLFLEEVGIGLVIGLGLAVVAGWAMRQAIARGWLNEIWHNLTVAALAITMFALAQALGGSGFIATFAGGLLFGTMARSNKHQLLTSAESTAEMLALLTWVIFGAAVVGQSVEHFTLQIVIYSVLSLTVIRMLPVYLSLTGLGLGYQAKLFLGWFGPRGLASIVFAVIVTQADLPGDRTLTMVVVCTVLLSILAHGMSANPLSRIIGRLAGAPSIAAPKGKDDLP